jgi:uncharacterized protein involved in exopolysaccharide biosynthesis
LVVSSYAADRELSVAFLLASLLQRRRAVFLFTLVGFTLGVILALVTRKTYTSTFSFISESGDNRQMGGLANIAGQFGISLGGAGLGSQQPQLYAELFSTRRLLSEIAQDSVTVGDSAKRRVPLADLLRVPHTDSAERVARTIAALRTKVVNASVAARTTGAVTVAVKTTSRWASFEIADALLRALNEFNLQSRQTQAGMERRFAESRLDIARKNQLAAEDSLQRFLQANRQFAPSSQLRFAQDRLESDVTLLRSIVRDLSQQVEEARIREVRDTPVISVIDRPALPAMRDPAGRIATVILSTLAGLVLGIAVVVTRAGWNEHRRRDPRDREYAMLSDEWGRVAARFGRARGG